MVGTLFRKIFGTRNDRELKRYFKRVAEINRLESELQQLSDQELKERFNQIKGEIRKWVADGEEPEKVLDRYLNQVFAITREASRRVLNMRHFDVQLVGGMVLHEGRIAEMKTGEGKTLVATLPVVLNAILGKGVHVVTVNDYLARRDAREMGKLYTWLGFSVGAVVGDAPIEEVLKAKEEGIIISYTPEDPETRKQAYRCDITYATNTELGFDYLRDNMVTRLEDKVQRGHYYAIVDEVDSILIDEARTPLIISGPANRRVEDYIRADQVAKQLKKGEHFTIDEKDRVVLLTEKGIEEAERLFGVENLYTPENAILAHHLDQALKANYLFKEGRDYIVRNGEVLIIDEFTGRIAEGRRFSEGLHQALEAKEGVEIKEESQTYAEITYQNYFRLYQKLAGMTGTAQTEATEFLEIYGLEVISIPTNKPVIRKDLNDLVFKTEEEKFEAVVKKVKELHKKGQPVLIGTTSVAKSEYLSQLLKKEGIPHTVLNAKHHDKEAEIIAKAGQKGAVTVATNMAGRGVDIKLGPGVKELGGLYIIGTERHESRRIDNQLRGRSGRQGDPGTSQFYLSLEDDLLRIFGSDRIKKIMDRLGIERGEHIDSRLVTRAIENAQKKVETLHFEARKHILKYDDVANEQRKVIYRFRDQLLTPEFPIDKKIGEMGRELAEVIVAESGISEVGEIGEEELNRLREKLKELEIGEVSVEEWRELGYSELVERLTELFKQKIEKKFQQLPEEDQQQVKREVLLHVLDESWRDHLYMMDILKTGIGLRGYNQKDPLVEYKKESYQLFQELIQRIKVESARVLLKLDLRPVEPEIEEFWRALQGKSVDEILEGGEVSDWITGVGGEIPGIGVPVGEVPPVNPVEDPIIKEILEEAERQLAEMGEMGEIRKEDIETVVKQMQAELQRLGIDAQVEIQPVSGVSKEKRGEEESKKG
ncbi:MAG: preprotein translocase subunit SecA [Campylobacterales bacterium]